MQIGNKIFDTRRHTYVCGILNVTPDSFSDGGQFNNMDNALYHVEKMVKEGAAIIDIGGESTRPGYSQVDEDEETERTAPVIRAVTERFDIPVSIDTCKAKVAEAGAQAGACMVNDIWGLKADPDMAGVIARNNMVCCIMHNRDNMNYVNLIGDMVLDLKRSVTIAAEAGIGDDRIILDPGIGFAKDTDMSLQIMNNLEIFTGLGYPVLLGASRKSVIGNTLDLPVEERLEGTLVTTVTAVMKHVSFVRVHDVEANVRAVSMAEAIRDAGL